MRNWQHTVNVTAPFRSDLPFGMRRDMIVSIIKGLPQYVDDPSSGEGDEDLWYIVDELADTRDEDEFDTVWDGFYDWCDDHDVWVETNDLPSFGLGVS